MIPTALDLPEEYQASFRCQPNAQTQSVEKHLASSCGIIALQHIFEIPTNEIVDQLL